MSPTDALTNDFRSYRCYLDNSNTLIEGQRRMAVNRGRARDLREAFDRDILDYEWRLSYAALTRVLGGQVGRLCDRHLFGSFSDALPLARLEAIQSEMESGGWTVHTQSRSCGRKEKGVDVELATHFTWDAALKTPRTRTGLVLIAGDRDYAPMVRHLVAHSYEVIVVFWDHAARELKHAAFRFRSLDSALATLTMHT